MSDLLDKLKQRRTYREFEKDSFDIDIIINAIEAAKFSPSGANKQPWSFCVIKNPKVKKEIRKKAEEIEKKFYQNISGEWKSDLDVLDVNFSKPFLEEAPYLIVIFKHAYQFDSLGNRTKVYYPDISIGIATGILIAALTDLGVNTLTYTPSPNHFLKDILNRPDNEKPYMVLVCGKGSKKYKLPEIKKKDNSEIITIY